MEDNWQTSRPTNKERSQYMHNNKLFSDVEFSVVNSKGETTTVPAHKYPLATSSPVFEAMFFGKLAETSRTISLPDCTAEGLLELFRYLYYDEVELTGGIVMEVLYLAKKYIVPSLVDECKKYLEENLEPEDVFSVLKDAEKLGDEKLKRICWKTIDSGAQRAVTSAPFLSVTQDKLCDILERDTLEIRELELFEAVDRWAQNKIQAKSKKSGEEGQAKRAVLGDKVIHLIRFPLMTSDEFLQNVLQTEILTMKEVKEMYKYHSCGDASCLGSFTTKERTSLPQTEIEPCWRFEKAYWCDYYSSDEDTITFTTDQRIYLTQVDLFGYGYRDQTVEISIYRQDELLLVRIETLYREESSRYNNGTPNECCTGSIAFDKIICVDPDIEYTIIRKAHIFSIGGIGDDGGKQSVKCKNVTFHFKEKEGSTAQGQFPIFYFYQYRKES